MKNKNKTRKTTVAKSLPVLSPQKKRIFWIITVSLPVVVLLLLEAFLQIFNYGGNLDLFIEGPPGYENYLRCNPNVARRYFFVQTDIPTPPKQLFLKQKPADGYRIFVLGESTAAGFPYSTNVSFPNILQRGLANTFPRKNIEVINISMSAINSYALLDLLDEIFEQSPDALCIYTGHNEYYGALGVGSVQSLGKWPWLIRTFLGFQSVKTVLLLRDCIGWFKIKFGKIFFKGSEIDPSATLMERIVTEQTIPLGSPLYEAGKRQFEQNMEMIIKKAADRSVAVVISELISNLRDQEPFVSVEDQEGRSAMTLFKQARQFEAANEFEKARAYYSQARDLDALRFRAPEEFNMIIRKLANKYSQVLVPAVSYFEKASPNELIGNTLILEHVHPNKAGYFLLAWAFYETMQSKRMIGTDWAYDGLAQEWNRGITDLDSVYAQLVIRQLKSGWPFQPKSLPNRFLQTFKPGNRLEEISFRVLKSKNFSLESAHMELGKFYEKENQSDQALAEYQALITSIPYEVDFYQQAGLVLIAKKEYIKASQLLQRSLRYRNNKFAYKWIGQIAFMQGDLEEAINYLLKADLQDTQVLFNLSRVYYAANQWENGNIYYERLKNLAPGSEYMTYLTKLRMAIQSQRDF
jgi:tetratricopeptide (TPR) repeat protein